LVLLIASTVPKELFIIGGERNEVKEGSAEIVAQLGEMLM
jgi:hypothetical protein